MRATSNIIEQVNRINSAKSDIISAIINIGGNVSSTDRISDLAYRIYELPIENPISAVSAYAYSGSTISEYSGSETLILKGAFLNCFSLTTVSFPNCSYIGDTAFLSCHALISVNFSNCSYIGSDAFSYCTSLATAEFPNCSYIYGSAFGYCSNLTSTNFSTCQHIGYQAFKKCISLTTINLPNCSCIEESAFSGCYNLISLYLTYSIVCNLYNSNAFSSTPIGGYSRSAGQYGSIYVPSVLLESYKIATTWAYFSSRFIGI